MRFRRAIELGKRQRADVAAELGYSTIASIADFANSPARRPFHFSSQAE
jgi:hypothetical protein